ncbi:MAG: tetratricopeptide repeat protein [Pseudomonas sp.]
MNKYVALLAAVLLLSGCQSLPTPGALTAEPTQKPTPSGPTAPPTGSFSPSTLHALLVAELAGQRDRLDLALDGYLQQARITRDSGVAERAYRIAEYLGDDDALLEAALLWAQSDSGWLDAQRAAAIQLARDGRHEEAMTYMEHVLNAQGDTNFDFLALSAARLDKTTRTGLLRSFERLLTRYPANHQLVFGRAVLLQQAGQPEEALKSLDNYPASQQEIILILLRSRLLESMGRSDEALPVLRKGIQQTPDDRRLRITYARLLLINGELESAREQFDEMLRFNPEDDDLRLSLAIIHVEAKHWPEARREFEYLLKRGQHSDAAHFHLGRIAEALGKLNEAIHEYGAVGPSEDYLTAQQRRSELLANANRLPEALERLAAARERHPGYAQALFQIEIDVLSRHNETRAWQSAEQAILQFPTDVNLLYARAMLADKRGDIHSVERDLRLILDREPDNAIALNALGYTLANRTQRYAEARPLIERAYALNPEDPAILDSLGWLAYRENNLPEAERWLRQALEQQQNDEIAAHLGEVLWQSGQQKAARDVWRTALEEAPESRIVRDTLQRLTGKREP